MVDTATAEMCGQVIYPAAVLGSSRNTGEAEAFLAYLQTIAQEYYEAAYVDGCGRWQAHVHIPFPQMKSAFAFLTIMGWITGMQRFTDVYTLGGMTGSPARSLHTIVGFIYERGFGNYEFGVASAASCILFVIILLFTLLNMKLTGGDES